MRVGVAAIALTAAAFAAVPLAADVQRAGLAVGAASSGAPNDYSDPAAWLCRPGRQDACAVDLTTTVVAADGTLTREPFIANPDPPVDCFYVYPTVSADPGPTSDMTPKAPEKSVIRTQFARFQSVCRPFAPMYRQVTLAGLRNVMTGGATSLPTRGVGYTDVRDAWRYYLEHDNHGRGVVLIGHSQGSFVLMELIRAEIDGTPVQKVIVSAILAGTVVPVPPGRNVGGVFKQMALCRSTSDTHCVVTYASYRATSPPPPGSLFGRVPLGPLEAACVNPAALAGGPAPLHSYFVTGLRRWVSGETRIDTPFVSVPGLISGECTSKSGAHYLEITVHGDPNDPRTDEIGGDSLPGWGLHQVDLSLPMGDLLDRVRQQTAAFRP